MAQFARPSADIAYTMLGATPVNTAGNRYQNVDEATPSDTDYCYSQNNPGGAGLCEFLLSAITDPGVDTDHVLRIRTAQIDEDSGSHPMGANTGGTATSCAWELRQGATVIQSGTISPGAFTTTVVNLTAGNVANITDYSDLRVHLNPSGGGGSTANRRAVAISFIELEAPDAPAGTQYPKSVAGALTFSGSTVKRSATSRAGALTFTASLSPTHIPTPPPGFPALRIVHTHTE